MGKAAQDNGRLLRFQIGQDQGNGLRVFLLNEVKQMGRIGAADEVKGPDLQRGGQPVDDVHRLLRAQRFFQQLPGVIDTAGGDEILGHHQFLEFHEYRIAVRRFYIFKTGNLKGKLFNLVFPQVLEDFRGNLRPQRDEEDGRLLPAGQLFLV